jgi:acetamidase/formamidase
VVWKSFLLTSQKKKRRLFGGSTGSPISRLDVIASIAVDYHVTQLVDGTKGIHGMIPKAIFTSQ